MTAAYLSRLFRRFFERVGAAAHQSNGARKLITQ
jgi:hypothetical protein